MDDFKKKLEKIIGQLGSELSALRTTRATPALVEDLEVECYGVKTPLKALASISVPEPRTLLIQPWDKSVLAFVEKAISGSALGVNPVVDRDSVRISLPPMTDERRKELVRVSGRYSEEARIRIRLEREEALKDIDKKEKVKEISEDEKFRRKKEIQEVVDGVNKKIEELSSAKEKEILKS